MFSCLTGANGLGACLALGRVCEIQSKGFFFYFFSSCFLTSIAAMRFFHCGKPTSAAVAVRKHCGRGTEIFGFVIQG